MEDHSRRRTATRVAASSVTSFASLAILNFLLPVWLGPGEFAEWRQISLALALAGVCHLGIGEGLYLWWVRNPTARQSRRSFARNAALAVVASAAYAVLTCATGLVDWRYLTLVFVAVATYAVYAMAFGFVQTHSDHPSYVRMFVMQPVGLAALVAVLGVTDLATPGTAALATAAAYLAATVYIVVTGHVIVRHQDDRPDESLRAILLRPNRGLALLAASLLYLLLVNIDKLVFNHRFPDTVFASYSLLSVLPNATMSLAGPVGIVLFARGALIRSRRILVVGASVGVAALGEVAVRVLHPLLEDWYVGYDLAALTWFTRLSGLTLALSLYYLPRLRVTQPRAFLVSLGAYNVVAAAAFALVPADLIGSPISSFACVNVVLMGAWLVVLDVIDRRPAPVQRVEVPAA